MKDLGASLKIWLTFKPKTQKDHTSERTRHTMIRYFFIHHYIYTKEIVLKYMPTANVLAEILTKP